MFFIDALTARMRKDSRRQNGSGDYYFATRFPCEKRRGLVTDQQQASKEVKQDAYAVLPESHFRLLGAYCRWNPDSVPDAGDGTNLMALPLRTAPAPIAVPPIRDCSSLAMSWKMPRANGWA